MKIKITICKLICKVYLIRNFESSSLDSLASSDSLNIVLLICKEIHTKGFISNDTVSRNVTEKRPKFLE